jgi:hypothetical protein
MADEERGKQEQAEDVKEAQHDVDVPDLDVSEVDTKDVKGGAAWQRPWGEG